MKRLELNGKEKPLGQNYHRLIMNLWPESIYAYIHRNMVYLYILVQEIVIRINLDSIIIIIENPNELWMKGIHIYIHFGCLLVCFYLLLEFHFNYY